MCGLQNQLNILWETAERLGLAVNLDKSNIIVFRNGGHTASCEKWVYGKNVMTVVNQYKYLCIYLSTRLTLSHALNMAQRAKKGVVGIFKLLWSSGKRFPSIFFKLFDTQIQPVLNYGAEVWELEADHTLFERIYLFAIKRFLNTSIRTPNVMVYGENGRCPADIHEYVCEMCKVLVAYFKDVSSPAAIQSVQDAATSTRTKPEDTGIFCLLCAV